MRPEFWSKVGACQEGSHGVRDGLMSTFYVTILAGGIGTSGVHDVSRLGEQILDFGVVEWFTPLVHVHVLVPTRWIVLC